MKKIKISGLREQDTTQMHTGKPVVLQRSQHRSG